MRQIVLLFSVFMLVPHLFYAQTIISGKVTTLQNEILPGASVALAGSYDGATTDTAGIFSFVTTEKGTQQLLVLFMGCDTFRQILEVTGQSLIVNPKLKEQKNQLGEVVVSAGTFEATSDRRRAAVELARQPHRPDPPAAGLHA